MSIATVRIAPIERWCKWALTEGGPPVEQRQLIVGLKARILTETCRASMKCDGKVWMQEFSNVNELRKVAGLSPLRRDYKFALCEHMLEMD